MHSKINQTKPNLKKHSLNSPTKPIQTTKQVYGGLSPPDERLMANKQPIDYVLPGRAMGWENIKTRGGDKGKKFLWRLRCGQDMKTMVDFSTYVDKFHLLSSKIFTGSSVIYKILPFIIKFFVHNLISFYRSPWKKLSNRLCPMVVGHSLVM